MNRKQIIWLLVLIIAVASTVFALLPDKSNKEAATPVNTAKVQKGNITVNVTGTGAVEAKKVESIYATDQGNIAKVLVKENQIVQKGQVLMTYEATDVSTNLRQQQNTLRQQQADLQDKQEQYKNLMMDGATQSQLDTAKSGIEKVKGDIVATQAEIAALNEDHIPPEPLKATIDGTITKINVSSGGMATDGAEAFTITDYNNLSVKIKIDELDIPKVVPGMSAAIILDALPDEPYSGKVTEIANEGTVTNGVSVFDVTIQLLDSRNARVGMSAKGTITIEEKQGILILPIESVTQSGNEYSVKVLKRADKSPAQGTAATKAGSPSAEPSQNGADLDAASTAEETKISVGVHDESQIEIISGLNAGDEVIVPTVVATQQQDTESNSEAGFGGGFGPPDGGNSIPGAGTNSGGSQPAPAGDGQ